MSETSELIKRIRALGLSQSEIARRTGIPQPRVSRWENGETATTADDALRLVALEQALSDSSATSATTEAAAADGRLAA